jgi:opacity protein-like surface antigen
MKAVLNTLATVCLIAFTTHSFTQPNITLKMGGLRSQWRGDGLNILNGFADITKSDLFHQDGMTSYYVGAGVSLPIGERFSIEPGLQYSRVGASLQGDLALKALSVLGVGLRVRAITDRLELPVLLRAEVARGLHLVAGPQLNYAMQSQLQLQGQVLGINLLNKKLDIGSAVEPLSVAALGGIQYQFANGFQLQGVYEYGLSRIAKNNAADIFQNSVRIGMGIPIGRRS